jgi:hypothetical protein
MPFGHRVFTLVIRSQHVGPNDRQLAGDQPCEATALSFGS